MTTRRAWTAAEVRTVKRLFPTTPTRLIAERLGRNYGQVAARAALLGLRKSAAYFAGPLAHRLDGKIGVSCQFKAGHTPWNKGTHFCAGGRSAETRFRPGNYSTRWDREIYCIGALRINCDGGLDIKVREGSRAWVPMARWVWASEHGPLPAGAVVRAINGDRDDTRIENLRLSTRADLMRENTLHNYPKPIARAIQLRGALVRQINRREGKHG